jgi:hypothetical protein
MIKDFNSFNWEDGQKEEYYRLKDYLDVVKDMGGNIISTNKSTVNFTIDYLDYGLLTFSLYRNDKFYLKLDKRIEELKNPNELLGTIERLVKKRETF